VVTGRSGSGKSTLFRLLAGIWPFGQGRVEVPPNAFFLPQRPYIPLGALQHIVAYPHAPETYRRTDMAEALRLAGLAHLVDRLDHDENWPQRLSGGEQQRVALARVLLARPDWIFLDEATASLDPDAEADLYRVLKEQLPNATLVSIAHRPSVAAFHDRKLELKGGAGRPGVLLAGD
jgi:putative ATP-binding cassette transporter